MIRLTPHPNGPAKAVVSLCSAGYFSVAVDRKVTRNCVTKIVFPFVMCLLEYLDASFFKAFVASATIKLKINSMATECRH